MQVIDLGLVNFFQCFFWARARLLGVGCAVEILNMRGRYGGFSSNGINAYGCMHAVVCIVCVCVRERDRDRESEGETGWG
jgi:hypothetical protein